VLLTSPKLSTGLYDTNNKALLKATATASAVNELTLANAATSGKPTLSATGTDTNIHINLVPKGTGEVQHTGVGPTRNNWTRIVESLYPSSTTAGTWIENTGTGWYRSVWYENNGGTPAINDRINYKIWLEAGVYTFTHTFRTGTNFGQVTILLDDVVQGAVLETYDATNHHIQRISSGNTIVAPNSYVTMSYKVTGKHASSSDYAIGFFFLNIVRTA
jgi:hypothetical protein